MVTPPQPAVQDFVERVGVHGEIGDWTGGEADQVRYVAGVADQGTERAVDIYTDGACSGNPGPGGWGAVLRYGTREKEIYGGEPAETTNNRMELMAPIRALESLTRPAVVRLHTDSKYVLDGVTKWLPRWKSNGWQSWQATCQERRPVAAPRRRRAPASGEVVLGQGPRRTPG